MEKRVTGGKREKKERGGERWREMRTKAEQLNNDCQSNWKSDEYEWSEIETLEHIRMRTFGTSMVNAYENDYIERKRKKERMNERKRKTLLRAAKFA